MSLPHRHLAALALLSCLGLAGCASASTSTSSSSYKSVDDTVAHDPIEPFNRVVFEVNDFLDRLLGRPLAELYRATVPPPLRDRIAGIVGNMSEPVVFANNVLQGSFDSAATTLGRFAVNTTLGAGGMFEVANSLDLPPQEGDFGQTLHVWGADEGAYLVLPLVGPSNVRDTVGLGVDTLMSPWKYLATLGGNATANQFAIANSSANAIVRREENIEALDALRQGSLDLYAQLRSVYRQHRAKQLGVAPNSMPMFDDREGPLNGPVVQ